MSSWGNLDNVAIKGTVTVAAANGNAVLGISSEFNSNVKAGDYVFIAANKYQVEQVISNTSIYLTSNAATTSAGVQAYVQQGPKYIANVALSENVYTIQRVYNVDLNEMRPNLLGSLTIVNAGAGYANAAVINNTTLAIATTGASQPTSNAQANLIFSGGSLVGYYINVAGSGYVTAAIANTTATLATTGAFLPTTNANVTLNFVTRADNAVHTGWVHYFTYTDALGQVRRKSEVLVAMSKNFNTDTPGNVITDAADDSIFPDG